MRPVISTAEKTMADNLGSCNYVTVIAVKCRLEMLK